MFFHSISRWDYGHLKQNHTHTRLSVTEIKSILYSHELIPIRCRRKKVLNCSDWDANIDCCSQLSHKRGNRDHLKDTGDSILHVQRLTTHWHHGLQTWHRQAHKFKLAVFSGGWEYNKLSQLLGKAEGTLSFSICHILPHLWLHSY